MPRTTPQARSQRRTRNRESASSSRHVNHQPSPLAEDARIPAGEPAIQVGVNLSSQPNIAELQQLGLNPAHAAPYGNAQSVGGMGSVGTPAGTGIGQAQGYQRRDYYDAKQKQLRSSFEALHEARSRWFQAIADYDTTSPMSDNFARVIGELEIRSSEYLHASKIALEAARTV